MGSPEFGRIVEGEGDSSSKIRMIVATPGINFSSQDLSQCADHYPCLFAAWKMLLQGVALIYLQFWEF